MSEGAAYEQQQTQHQYHHHQPLRYHLPPPTTHSPPPTTTGARAAAKDIGFNPKTLKKQLTQTSWSYGYEDGPVNYEPIGRMVDTKGQMKACRGVLDEKVGMKHNVALQPSSSPSPPPSPSLPPSPSPSPSPPPPPSPSPPTSPSTSPSPPPSTTTQVGKMIKSSSLYFGSDGPSYSTTSADALTRKDQGIDYKGDAIRAAALKSELTRHSFEFTTDEVTMTDRK